MKDYHINVFYSEDDEGYIADIPDLQSCSAFGETPEEALQGHAAHLAEWSATLRPKGSSSPCIPEAVATFFHTAFTAHSDVGA